MHDSSQAFHVQVLFHIVVSKGGAPEEGADGELALLLDVAGNGQAIVGEDAVELPLGHVLIVGHGVPGVVHRHLKRSASHHPLLPLRLHELSYSKDQRRIAN